MALRADTTITRRQTLYTFIGLYWAFFFLLLEFIFFSSVARGFLSIRVIQNILFFGTFTTMKEEEFVQGMEELIQNPDILSTLDRTGIKTVAFKAEMDSEEGLNNAVKLLTQKRVDAVCYNLLQDAKSFGGDENEITFITKASQTPLGRADKLTLSERIVSQAKALSHE